MSTPTKTSAKKTAAVKKSAPSHPSFYSMTVEAITQSTDRKGATVPAIRNYITETHKAVDPAALKFRLKQALTKAVDQAVVEKVKSEDRPLMSSRFRLNKAKAAADEKEKKKKVNVLVFSRLHSYTMRPNKRKPCAPIRVLTIHEYGKSLTE